MENTPRLPESVIKGNLAEMKVDQVGLWELVSDTQREFKIHKPSEIREVVLDAARRLLEHAVVIISYRGQEKAYEVWNFATEEAISRLEKKWDVWEKLDKLPDMGDGIYFIYKEQLPHFPTIPEQKTADVPRHNICPQRGSA